MNPIPSFADVPVFGTSASQIKPPNDVYTNGYPEGAMFPTEHASWLFNRLTGNLLTATDSVTSIITELDNYLVSQGLTPSSGLSNQLQTAITAQIAAAIAASGGSAVYRSDPNYSGSIFSNRSLTTSYQLMGLRCNNAAATITLPAGKTALAIQLCGNAYIQPTAFAPDMFMALYIGTGAPPAAGSWPPGLPVCEFQQGFAQTGATQSVVLNIGSIATGLTAGATYWIDIALRYFASGAYTIGGGNLYLSAHSL